MSHIAQLFDEAWGHRRRRRRTYAWALLWLAGTVAVIAVVQHGAGPGSTAGTSTPPTPHASVVAPAQVLSKTPFMGVSCHVANSIACDRVSLAVWLKRPAVSVGATIAGAKLTLHTGGELADNLGPRGRAFVGFLQPAGIVTRLHIRPEDGNIIITRHGRTHVKVAHRMWFGDGDARSSVVQLTIRTATSTLVTRLRVGLSPGSG
jgi:hypothetical protein